MEKAKKIQQVGRFWAIPIGCGLMVLLLFRFVLILAFVPTSSMEPTITEGSYIWGTRIFNELQRGDIVIFKRGDRNLVKRIAAVPGDIVYLDDETHTAVVNIPLAGADRTLVLSDGYYFMLGDNSAESFDSRYWEEPFIAEAEIIAKLF